MLMRPHGSGKHAIGNNDLQTGYTHNLLQYRPTLHTTARWALPLNLTKGH
jgi:hypothetical protein